MLFLDEIAIQVTRFSKWLFQPSATDASNRDIWHWWGERRLTYNAINIATGVVSFFAFMFFCVTSGLLQPGEDAEEPMGLALAAVIGPVLWNFAYCLEPTVDMILRRTKLKRSYSPLLLKAGIAFSIFVFMHPLRLVVWNLD